jgi:Flp pilus assembly protein TadG
MQGYRLRGNERGTVLLFMLGSLLFLLIFGGFAIDLAFYSTTKGELQRSMDAAALAGAAQLGLDDSTFPAVRQEAQRFAGFNPTRANLSELNPTGAINLDQNSGNADLDGVTLGVWDGATFTPSVTGSEVNAVRCQYATTVPTSFLGILGPDLNTLPVSARAIAVSNPPDALPPGACMFPMGTTSCQFQNAGAYNSLGCGSPMTFATSSGNPPDTQAGTNTAAWTNPNGIGTPDDETLIAAINAAADGQGSCNSPINAGEDVGTNNGMVQSVVDVVEGHFLTKYAESVASGTPHTVADVDGNSTYAGFGWEVWVGVIETDCPPQAINQNRTIQTFARFVITQVINHGFCAVDNSADPNSWPLCPPPMNPAGAPRDPSLRGIFGFFQCQDIDDTIPATTAVPRTGLATGTRLVQ